MMVPKYHRNGRVTRIDFCRAACHQQNRLTVDKYRVRQVHIDRFTLTEIDYTRSCSHFVLHSHFVYCVITSL